MNFEWQGPTTPRELRAKLGYKDAELLLCQDTGVVIDYGLYGLITFIFMHKGSRGDENGVGAANVGDPWGPIHPLMSTYQYEVAMLILDNITRTFASLPDDAGFGQAKLVWALHASMFGWDHDGFRIQVDEYLEKRGQL